MRLIYIDESKDTQNDICAYSALCIHIEDWHDVFDQLVSFRKWLKDQYDLPMSFEMHASNFIAGRSKHLFNRINTKDRIEIYQRFVFLAAQLKNAQVLNAIGKLKDDNQFLVFEWLINRLDAMLLKEGSYGILICDEGDNTILTKMTRKMRKENLVPDHNNPNAFIDLKITRLVEDPVFKKSHDSYFVQLVDFIVHAFLRFEHPLEGKEFLTETFMMLENILHKNDKDPKNLGIIRET